MLRLIWVVDIANCLYILREFVSWETIDLIVMIHEVVFSTRTTFQEAF